MHSEDNFLRDMSPMEQTADTPIQPPSTSTAADTHITRRLYTLALALIFGGVVVWQLRQEWAKDQIWPWFFFLIAMFAAAGALRQMDLWLPGQSILPKLEKVSTQTLTLLGSICIALALAL